MACNNHAANMNPMGNKSGINVPGRMARYNPKWLRKEARREYAGQMRYANTAVQRALKEQNFALAEKLEQAFKDAYAKFKRNFRGTAAELRRVVRRTV